MGDETPAFPRPDILGSGRSPVDPLEALREECEQVSKVALGLSEEDFSRPTRCSAWNVKELLAHMYWGLNRARRSLAEPAPEVADTDSVTYWRSYDPLEDAPGIGRVCQRDRAGRGLGRPVARGRGVGRPRGPRANRLDVGPHADPGRIPE